MLINLKLISQGNREYPRSELVLFILVLRVISAFKMAGGRFIAIV